MSEKMDELISVMKEILKYTKFAGAKEVRNVLGPSTRFTPEQKRLIYHFSDGNNGSTEIAKKVNVGDSTVRRYWASWSD